ncbi:N-acetyl-1-D-myo-inositol-2-amino-2-deoxy-alpha-D -glucopyranoside deacetylase [Saccharopolyspora halophila]|uniref:1D-myo-inositol 2-acetamido-2-deoxy-alpha-D-glucopyranoside deacetylase n=1 Tax=Saccharopolyspora halophila TaxID=405551 RepID=A0ABP5SJ82_9PSEU
MARFLLVHAHPDDETLWTGGTIARYAARGVEVMVVTCTLGEAGEVIPAELRGLVSDEADQLGGYRIGELRSALAALRVSEHRFLGGAGRWRDSGMLWDEPGRATAVPDAHPRAFAIGDLAEQTDQLVQIIEEFRPEVVVTYAADGGYGHPDHIRAHEVTEAAVERSTDVRRLFHAVPSRQAQDRGLAELAESADLPFRLPESHELPGVDEGSITTAIDVAEHLPAKIAALRAHATQVEVWVEQRRDGAGIASFALSNGIAQPLLGTEHYVLASGDANGCATDLFGGLETR